MLIKIADGFHIDPSKVISVESVRGEADDLYGSADDHVNVRIADGPKGEVRSIIIAANSYEASIALASAISSAINMRIDISR